MGVERLVIALVVAVALAAQEPQGQQTVVMVV
jgi:hypothetical protein